MADEVFPLRALQEAVAALRADVKMVQDTHTAVSRKIATLNSNKDYSDTYKKERAAEERKAAAEQAKTFLMNQDTYKNIDLVKSQAGKWDVRAFFQRAPNAEPLELTKYGGEENTHKLLKAVLAVGQLQATLISLGQSDTESVSEAADAALASGDWQTARCCWRLLGQRMQGAGEDAERARRARDVMAAFQ